MDKYSPIYMGKDINNIFIYPDTPFDIKICSIFVYKVGNKCIKPIGVSKSQT